MGEQLRDFHKLSDGVAIQSIVSHFHVTKLLIEGKPCDVNFTEKLKNSRWQPAYVPTIVNDHISRIGRVEVYVHAENTIISKVSQ